MRYSREELRRISDELGQPVIVEKKEGGLTPKQKKILEDTMRRHNGAFKKLADT